MLNYIIIYIASLIWFLLLDFTWLGFIAKDLYRNRMGDLVAKDINWIAAIIFYMLFVLGIQIFATRFALDTKNWMTALTYGLMFGFFTYMTYDLTNLAVIRNWDTTLTIIDIVWGSFLGTTTALIGYFVGSKLLGN